MEIVSASMLEAIYSNFTVLFLQGRGSASPVAGKLATIRNTTTRENKFIIPGQLGRMRKWIGERVAQNINAQDIKLAVEDYEATVEVDRNDILDDQLGIYTDMIQDLGKQAAFLQDDLVTDALLQGETNLAYDGQYFFDTDHPLDMANAASATQANLFTSRPLNEANYAYVRAQGALLRGPDGRAMRLTFDTLVVGPNQEVAARRLVQSKTSFDATTGGPRDNVLEGTATVVVLPEITDDSWYLIAGSNAVKPVILLVRQAPKLVRKDDDRDESAFWRKKYHYGVDARMVAGYGPWWLALKAKP